MCTPKGATHLPNPILTFRCVDQVSCRFLIPRAKGGQKKGKKNQSGGPEGKRAMDKWNDAKAASGISDRPANVGKTPRKRTEASRIGLSPIN
jgi:hypothetical protein